jgi:hypothetical protein
MSGLKSWFIVVTEYMKHYVKYQRIVKEDGGW